MRLKLISEGNGRVVRDLDVNGAVPAVGDEVIVNGQVVKITRRVWDLEAGLGGTVALYTDEYAFRAMR